MTTNLVARRKVVIIGDQCNQRDLQCFQARKRNVVRGPACQNCTKDGKPWPMRERSVLCLEGRVKEGLASDPCDEFLSLLRVLQIPCSHELEICPDKKIDLYGMLSLQ